MELKTKETNSESKCLTAPLWSKHLLHIIFFIIIFANGSKKRQNNWSGESGPESGLMIDKIISQET